MITLVIVTVTLEVLVDLHAAFVFRVVRTALISCRPIRNAALILVRAVRRVPASERLTVVSRVI